MLKDTSNLSWTSTLGNLAVFLGVSSVVYYAISEELDASQPLSSYKAFDFNGLSQFFGVALFSFACPAEIIMIEQSISTKKEKIEFRNVFTKIFIFVAILYMSFGSICYICFDENTQEIIFQSVR